MVMATQNPVEQEGTYPLPEAQLDRFLMKVVIEYPSSESEIEVLRLVRGESKSEFESDLISIPQSAVFNARSEINEIHVSEGIEKYIVDLIDSTRFPEKYSEELKAFIEVGSSPRGTIALDKCARVNAWLDQRDHVTPDDVRLVVHDVLRHRIMLSYEANADGVTSDHVIDELLKVVAVA
jgi:MoxR-like ATPase